MTASAAIASWRPRTVPEEAAAFAREVVARAAPTSRARAKALLFAASRAAGFSLDVGLELRPEVVFCPTVIERFIVANARAFSAPTARTLRTNCRALGRALQAYPEPAPVRLPRERAKKPYTASEISAYLALADAQPNPSRRMRAQGVICLGSGGRPGRRRPVGRTGQRRGRPLGRRGGGGGRPTSAHGPGPGLFP